MGLLDTEGYPQPHSGLMGWGLTPPSAPVWLCVYHGHGTSRWCPGGADLQSMSSAWFSLPITDMN